MVHGGGDGGGGDGGDNEYTIEKHSNLLLKFNDLLRSVRYLCAAYTQVSVI